MAMEGEGVRGDRTRFLHDPTLFNLIRDERWQEAWNLVESDPTAPYNAYVSQRFTFPLHLLCKEVKFIDHQEDPEFSDFEDRENTEHSEEDHERNEEIYQLARFMIQQSHTIRTPIILPDDLRQMDDDTVTVTSHRSILTLKNDEEETAFHILLQYSYDPNMIQIIVDGALTIPGLLEQLTTDILGASALHQVSNGECPFSCLRLMMKFFHGDRLVPDTEGDLPLHWALTGDWRLNSPRRTRLLIEGCNESLLVRNVEGNLPMHALERAHLSEWDGANEAERRSLWNRLEPILRTVMGSVESDNDALPTLHAIASGLSFIPTKFLQIALELNDDTVYDSDGLIPLHRAVFKPPKEETIGMYTVSVLLLVRETTVGMPTRAGRLSLHLAAESNQPEVIVSELARVAPRSLSAIDPVTQLIPFQLAAAEDNNSLANVYSLLRMNPSLL